jgi:hypothetical protein
MTFELLIVVLSNLVFTEVFLIRLPGEGGLGLGCMRLSLGIPVTFSDPFPSCPCICTRWVMCGGFVVVLIWGFLVSVALWRVFLFIGVYSFYVG